MESAQLHLVQKIFAERAEVRAVAKAPWCYADKLPAGNQQPLNECDEAGVEVTGFNADGMKGTPFGGIGADFAIRRIRDGGIEGGRR